jgi:N-acetylmuramidase-like protein
MIIEPGKAIPLTDNGLSVAAKLCGATREELWTVVQVETAGCGFLRDRRPTILFERHVFYRLTEGQFFPMFPTVCNPEPGGYGLSGSYQYTRLDTATELDRDAALKSASWGLGQIMGENAGRVGYSDVQEMIDDFRHSENAHLYAIAAYICNARLSYSLQSHNWKAFAKGYNGPGFAKNMYDKKLSSAYRKIRKDGLPNLQIRARQICHMFEGKYRGLIDGVTFPVSEDC